jgi:hypothetical protein
MIGVIALPWNCSSQYWELRNCGSVAMRGELQKFINIKRKLCAGGTIFFNEGFFSQFLDFFAEFSPCRKSPSVTTLLMVGSGLIKEENERLKTQIRNA